MITIKKLDSTTDLDTIILIYEKSFDKFEGIINEYYQGFPNKEKSEENPCNWIFSLNIFPAGRDGIHACGAHTVSARGIMAIKRRSQIPLALQATFCLIGSAFTQNFMECLRSAFTII